MNPPAAPYASTVRPTTVGREETNSANGTAHTGQTLPLVRRLCEALDAAGVSYCHWKSNNALAKSASGENDLDLLVARADAARFTEILFGLGFKELHVAAQRHIPGILNFYGFEPSVDRLVHVHAHYQLVVGHDMTKNFHLPVEAAYLESCGRDGLFPVPAPEFELILYVIRLILKHSTWDTIFLFRQGTIKENERREFDYLVAKSDPTRLEAILRRHFPHFSLASFEYCRESLRPRSSLSMRLRAGRIVTRTLASQGRRGPLVDMLLKFTGRWRNRIATRLSRYGSKKRFARGGAIIGIVGGDGSGKSTAVTSLTGWLKKDMATLTVHMGRPKRSKTTWLVRAAVKLARLTSRSGREALESELSSNSDTSMGIGRMLQLCCIARDRYLTYLRARRYATDGGVVVCDRFPLPEIGVMDGPAIRRLLQGAPVSRLGRRLMELEESFYPPIRPPEILLALKVDPEIAVERRKDEDPVPVRARNTALCAVDFGPYGGHEFQSDQTREELLAKLKAVVWSKL